MRLSILMPVYNEAATIAPILERVLAVPYDKEVIVVDDGSTDGTREILARLVRDTAGRPEGRSLRVLSHDRNRGKGTAIRAALAAATGDIVIIQDADLEYDPDDYPALLAPIAKGKADVVYGSRFTGQRRNMFFWHWLGNRFLTFVTNLLYNTTLSDMETGYKVFRREALEGIRLRARRFDFDPEVTAKLLRRGHKIYEVPISFAGRDYAEGKKITWRDGFVALWCLLRYRFFD